MTDAAPAPDETEMLPPLCEPQEIYHVRGHMINAVHDIAERHGYWTAKTEDSAARIKWIRTMWWKVWAMGLFCGACFGFSLTMTAIKYGWITP